MPTTEMSTTLMYTFHQHAIQISSQYLMASIECTTVTGHQTLIFAGYLQVQNCNLTDARYLKHYEANLCAN